MESSRTSFWEQLDDWMGNTLPAEHPLDFVLPWMARELARLAKEVRKGRATDIDWDSATLALQGRGTAIGMWAKGEKVDLSKTTLAQALEAVEDYEVDTGEAVPQGTVVFTWDDGWTIQQLVDPEQLEAEGEVMQHCVGDYCEGVAAGETQIFSLRDPKGRPHATIEYASDITRLVQVQGKQNQAPKPEYQARVDEWAKDKGVAPADALTDEEDANVREYGEQAAAETWDHLAEDPDFNILQAEGAPRTRHGGLGIDVDVDDAALGLWGRNIDIGDLLDAIREAANEAAEDRWREIYADQEAALEDIIDDAEQRAEASMQAGEDVDVEEAVNDAFNASEDIGTYGHLDWQYVYDAVQERLPMRGFASAIGRNPGAPTGRLWPAREAKQILAAFGRAYDGIDEQQLRRGIVVELEHTDNPVIAAKIALDHLAEMRDYYARLDAMETAAGQ